MTLDAAWLRKLDEFCARQGRPRHLYEVPQVTNRIPEQHKVDIESMWTKFKIGRWGRGRLRTEAIMCRVPYWDEMRADELRAVLHVIAEELGVE